MLQQQCHHVRVALLCCLVQGGVAQLQGRTEGAAISSGSLLAQKCPQAWSMRTAPLPHQPARCPWSTGHLCTLVLALTSAWCCSKNLTSLMFP